MRSWNSTYGIRCNIIKATKSIDVSRPSGSCSSSCSSSDVYVVVDVIREGCQQVINGMLAAIEGNMTKSEAAKKQCGKKGASKRRQFAHVVKKGLLGWEVASKYGNTQSMLSRWISNQSEFFKQANEREKIRKAH